MENKFDRIFERVLVFTTATSLIISTAAIFSIVINNNDVERIIIDWFTYFVIAASGVIFTLVLQIFALEKIKNAMHIVFIVFYIIAALILCAVTGKNNAPYVLIPFLTIQYFIEAGLNEMFIFHDRFLFECEEYDGKELETYLFHSNLTAIDLTEKVKNQQAILFGLSVAMFIVIVFGKLSKGLFNPLITFFVIIFYLSVYLCYFTIGLFRNDVFYAFLGFKNYVKNKKRLLRSILIIFMISCSAGAVISSDNPIIKISYVEEFKDKTEQKYNKPRNETIAVEPVFENSLDEYLGKDSKPSWIVEVIFEIIKYAFIVLLSIAGIVFFIKPFFTNHWKVFWKEGRLIKFLHEIWIDIKTFIRYMFTKSPDPEEHYSTVKSRKFQESMMDFLKKAKRSKEKEAEIDRLTKHFMRLIDWGEAHNIKYRANLAPAEYTSLINTESSAIAGMLFEKALYDKNVLSPEEEARFIESIKSIIL